MPPAANAAKGMSDEAARESQTEMEGFLEEKDEVLEKLVHDKLALNKKMSDLKVKSTAAQAAIRDYCVENGITKYACRDSDKTVKVGKEMVVRLVASDKADGSEG